MTDLIYITGGRSAWQDNELRYSLRSMQKYLTNMGNVFIVGTCPEWLAGVTHIPAEDYLTEKKEVRLYRKIMKACRDERISENALLCYDDNFLLQEHDADTFPNYYEGDLELYDKRVQRNGTHKRCIGNTIALLGGSALMFDVHCPIMINRKEFMLQMSSLDWKQPDGYLIKSTYANLAQRAGTECRDTKINHPDGTLAEYCSMIEDKPFFSTGDNCNWQALGALMKEICPEPSWWGK